MLRLNTDSINSDVIMVGNNAIEYYDENTVSLPSTEYMEEILNMVESQKKIFNEVYNQIFLYYEQTPEIIDTEHKVQIPWKTNKNITNYCFCTLLFLLLVTTLFSTICFSVCIRNKKKPKIIKVKPFDLEKTEPQIIKAEPL